MVGQASPNIISINISYRSPSFPRRKKYLSRHHSHQDQYIPFYQYSPLSPSFSLPSFPPFKDPRPNNDRQAINNNQIPHLNMSSKFSFSSTFNWQDSNLKSLLHPILFSTEKRNDKDQPFCHFTHKNLGTKMAPFRQQQFTLFLDDLTNIKYISIDNYTHGAEMTISISDNDNGPFTEVYKDEYICKGRTLKNSNKLVDVGTLPCRSIKIRVNKGCNISSKNISLIGIESSQIQEKLGEDYFKLLVANPMKILYLI